MKLKTSYDSAESIPEGFANLYTKASDDEKDTTVVLTGIDGVFTQKDRDNLTRALEAERAARQKAEKTANSFSTVDVDEYKALKEKLPTLEEALKAANKDNQAAIDAAVEQRVSPLERDYKQRLEELSSQNKALKEKAEEASKRLIRRDFNDKLTQAAQQSGILPEAFSDTVRRASEFGWQLDENGDLVALKRDGSPRYSQRNPMEPMSMDEYLNVHLAETAPHLFKSSKGGGATNGKGPSSGIKKRSEMTDAEKTNYISTHGHKAFMQLPLR